MTVLRRGLRVDDFLLFSLSEADGPVVSEPGHLPQAVGHIAAVVVRADARGVDVGAKKEIYQLINQFKQEGLSIILVSSEMPEVLGMSDRILVMHEGQISGEFSIEQATQEVLMAAAVGKRDVLKNNLFTL